MASSSLANARSTTLDCADDDRERDVDRDHVDEKLAQTSGKRGGRRHSQRFARKKPSRPISIAATTATITQNACAVPSPGNATFIPNMPVMTVILRSTTLKTVSTRRTWFCRCEITDSFVSSSASTTSL